MSHGRDRYRLGTRVPSGILRSTPRQLERTPWVRHRVQLLEDGEKHVVDGRRVFRRTAIVRNPCPVERLRGGIAPSQKGGCAVGPADAEILSDIVRRKE